MLTANVIKIKKCILANITFILNVLSKNGVIFLFRCAYFLRPKNILNFIFFYRLCACVKMPKYITSQVPIVPCDTFIQFIIIEQLKHFKSKDSRKTQRPLKVINEVEDEIEVCGTYGSKDIVQLSFPCRKLNNC